MEGTWKERLERDIETLRQGRDELRVQIHLGAAEAQEAWEGVEQNWEHLEAHVKRLGQVARESAEDVEEAAKLLVDEIKAGYEKVRSFL